MMSFEEMDEPRSLPRRLVRLFFAIANSELVNVNGTKPGGLLPVWEVLEAMTTARRDGRFCSPC
jgi:hypothetical protein